MKRKALIAGIALALAAAAIVFWVARRPTLTIGAVYPTGGGQGPGGIEEYRGLTLAAALQNNDGGVHGRTIDIHLKAADSADAAPGAVQALASQGAPVIAGSYGSTISFPAAQAAYHRGLDFWETGAVGDLGMLATDVPPPYLGSNVFRFPPAGSVLGSSAVDFVANQLRSSLPDRPLRYTVAYVNDAYGAEVGQGALDQISKLGLTLAAKIPYDLLHADYNAIVDKIAAARTDVLFVASYIDDAVSMRKAILAKHVPLVANIGTSSSYCLPAFGEQLGPQAVGLFASDKPDGDILKASNLTPEAASALEWGRSEYARRYGGPMTAAALTGFAGGWALFHHVLPAAKALTPTAIADAARSTQLPMGALPNGSGLAFGRPGGAGAGENLRALSVIWEWTAPNTRSVVWPPAYATSPVEHLAVSSPA
ncbi:MAG: branched-chain amino acid transport system substrate-binding protein [Actinomycetota bacterium]|jgi:ABC-type branched-subunit amino acid transport system substrate-binding protein|nr:branched-chain amino acid transport system substrate-binding protein [Actinomycetota bacterium]